MPGRAEEIKSNNSAALFTGGKLAQLGLSSHGDSADMGTQSPYSLLQFSPQLHKVALSWMIDLAHTWVLFGSHNVLPTFKTLEISH